MNQLQHEQYRKVNQSEYPCSDHPKIPLMRTESCAEGRSLNEFLKKFPKEGHKSDALARNTMQNIEKEA